MSVSISGNNSCTPCRGTSTSSGCQFRLPGECVYYSGSNISGPGINTGDTLNILVNKLTNYISAGPGTVTSVGLIMPFGFTVTGSPVTSSGTLTVSAPNEWVSVNDYGAVGNGIVDDTVNIQTALNSGAKTILFAQGIYNISAPLLVNSNITLIGYGATIFRNANIDNMLRNNADGVTGGYTANQNIKLYGLAFDGNKTTFPANSTLVAFGHAQKIIIQNCTFYNIPGAWHGVELNAVQDASVEGCCYYNGSTAEELQLDLAANSGLFPWFGPYDNTPCKNIVINGNLFTDGGAGVGSHSAVLTFHHTNITISNNAFRNLTSDAIRVPSYKNLVITGNVIDTCAGNGIAAFTPTTLGAENYTISNNTFSNITNNQGGINIFFITGVSIIGNNISKCTAWGIFVGNSSNVVINGNTIKEASQSVTTDYAAIDVAACVNGYITNNVALKDPAGLVTGVNTIKISTSPFGGSTNTNITIENNTVSAPAIPTTFRNFAGTITNVIVGTNTINTVVTPFISTKTTNYTYTPTDSVLNVDTTAGNITITVNPTIFNKSGLVVRKTTADVNTVTITPSSGTINGAASLVLTTQNQAANIKSDWVNLNALIGTS